MEHTSLSLVLPPDRFSTLPPELLNRIYRHAAEGPAYPTGPPSSRFLAAWYAYRHHRITLTRLDSVDQLQLDLSHSLLGLHGAPSSLVRTLDLSILSLLGIDAANSVMVLLTKLPSLQALRLGRCSVRVLFESFDLNHLPRLDSLSLFIDSNDELTQLALLAIPDVSHLHVKFYGPLPSNNPEPAYLPSSLRQLSSLCLERVRDPTPGGRRSDIAMVDKWPTSLGTLVNSFPSILHLQLLDTSVRTGHPEDIISTTLESDFMSGHFVDCLNGISGTRSRRLLSLDVGIEWEWSDGGHGPESTLATLPRFDNLTYFSVGAALDTDSSLPTFLRSLSHLATLRFGMGSKEVLRDLLMVTEWEFNNGKVYRWCGQEPFVLYGPGKLPKLKHLILDCFGGVVGKRTGLGVRRPDERSMEADGWKLSGLWTSDSFHAGLNRVLAVLEGCKEDGVRVTGTVHRAVAVEQATRLEVGNRLILRSFACADLTVLAKLRLDRDSAEDCTYHVGLFHPSPLFADQLDVTTLDVNNLKLVKCERSDGLGIQYSLE